MKELLKKRLKISTPEGKYILLYPLDLKIKMYCVICKKWVTPEEISLGKSHIYGIHCNAMQELGCTIFLKRKELKLLEE